MDASEFEARKIAVLEECVVVPAIFAQVVPRLERFLEPFVGSLGRREQEEHAVTFVQGLLSDLPHKNAESIAYRFGQQRLPLQHFRAPSRSTNTGRCVGVGRWSAARRTRAADRSRTG